MQVSRRATLMLLGAFGSLAAFHPTGSIAAALGESHFDGPSPSSITPGGHVLMVSKTIPGSYTTIGAAVANAGAGDTIEIADSAIYYEGVTLALSDITLTASPGESPYISGQTLPATASAITVAAPATIKGIGVYVGGAQYGINVIAGPVLVDDVSFDISYAARGANWTFGLFVGADVTVSHSSFLGPDSVGQTSGGILSNSSVPIQLVVTTSDFWGIGTAGGSIGVGQPAGSALTVTGNVFGQTSTNGPIIAVNSWGTTTLAESHNAFRNINAAVGGGFVSHVLDVTDKKTFGGTTPSTAAQTQLTVANAADPLTAYLGCPVASTFSFPNATLLNHLLDRVIISNYFGESWYLPGYPMLDTDVLATMNEIQPRVWEEFQISWARQFDPAVWQNVSASAARVHAEPALAQTLLMGNLMEAISDSAVAATPMSPDLWLWYAYAFPDAASRPLQAKYVDLGHRRRQGHWFDPAAMSGYGGAHFWDHNPSGDSASIPNLQKQEGVVYFLYLARAMIDAGLNVIQFNEPNLTFGQGFTSVNTAASLSFMSLARFVKEYGMCRGRISNGQRFALISLSEAYQGLQNDVARNATRDVDYAEASAGTNSGGGGVNWTNGLGVCPHNGGAFATLPPSNAVIAGKPLTLDFDNNGSVTDEISVYAHATPAQRNTWLPCFDQAATALGYHLALNGIRDVTGGPQSFTGYPAPLAGQYPTGFLLPFDAYGDIGSTEAAIFAPR